MHPIVYTAMTSMAECPSAWGHSTQVLQPMLWEAGRSAPQVQEAQAAEVLQQWQRSGCHARPLQHQLLDPALRPATVLLQQCPACAPQTRFPSAHACVEI